MSTVIEKWDEILEIVKKEHDLSDVRFDTWLKPLKVFDVSGNVVTIIASDQVRLSYINKNYKLPLQVTISEVTGMTDCEVKFILPEDVPTKKSTSESTPDQNNRFKDPERNCCQPDHSGNCDRACVVNASPAPSNHSLQYSKQSGKNSDASWSYGNGRCPSFWKSIFTAEGDHCMYFLEAGWILRHLPSYCHPSWVHP